MGEDHRPFDLLAAFAAVLTWGISGLLLGIQVTNEIGPEAPLVSALVIITGVLVLAIVPAVIAYAVAR